MPGDEDPERPALREEADRVSGSGGRARLGVMKKTGETVLLPLLSSIPAAAQMLASARSRKKRLSSISMKATEWLTFFETGSFGEIWMRIASRTSE